jgi:uncharacterized membrane protein YhfC
MIAASVVAILFMIIYPLALGVLAHRRLHVGWRYFGYGMLVFFLSQLVLRIPLTIALGLLIGPRIGGTPALLLAWGLVLALTAGIFEEVGRYLGYRWLMGREEKTWSKGVIYGLGHGGLESMLLVAGLAIAQLVTLLTLTPARLEALPPEQRALAQQQLAALAGLPAWAPLLGAWERLWTIPIQVALSVVVLQVFLRGSYRWLWLAILAHALTDFLVPFVVPRLGLAMLPQFLVQEGLLMIIGLFAVWVIWRLRPSPVTPLSQIPLAEASR